MALNNTNIPTNFSVTTYDKSAEQLISGEQALALIDILSPVSHTFAASNTDTADFTNPADYDPTQKLAFGVSDNDPANIASTLNRSGFSEIGKDLSPITIAALKEIKYILKELLTVLSTDDSNSAVMDRATVLLNQLP